MEHKCQTVKIGAYIQKCVNNDYVSMSLLIRAFNIKPKLCVVVSDWSCMTFQQRNEHIVDRGWPDQDIIHITVEATTVEDLWPTWTLEIMTTPN